MKLTKNFSFEEMCSSNAAARNGLKNRPKTQEEEATVKANLKALCTEVLQPLRNHLKRKVMVSSGYRPEEVNKLVGGVQKSQHLVGEAADLRVDSTEHLLKMMHFIMDETDFDQLIWEKSKSGRQWVHVSYKREGVNRHQVLNAKKEVMFTTK